jgi:glucose/arabinose dehydrogenase
MRFLPLALAFLLAVPASAQLTVEAAFPNLSFGADGGPVGIEHDPTDDARLYVVKKDGIIRSFENDPEVAMTTVFLDIDDRVSSGGERGLLGLAFHPEYATNGYLYVSYTAGSSPGISRISRFSRSATDPATADPESEVVLLEIDQPFGNHNGGGLTFGPDGYLYASFGDGGSGGDPEENGQDETNLLGAILRLDVDGGGTAPDCGGAEATYTVPEDNQLNDGPGGACDEIYAYGLRNPWRFSFDRDTGQGWIADVGQSAWEEIDVMENGGNYGWDVKEGFECFEAPSPGEPACDDPSLIDPVWVYDHSLGCSVTGGYVYRGGDVPELAGKYIYGDYCTGRLWALDVSGAEPQNEQLPVGTFGGLTSFGEDDDGELYFVRANGSVYRFASETTTSSEGGVPAGDAWLAPPAPNPFRGTTAVSFRAGTRGSVRVAVYDVLGREVAVLHDGLTSAQEETVTFDASALPAGLYIVRLEAEGVASARRVIHVR